MTGRPYPSRDPAYDAAAARALRRTRDALCARAGRAHRAPGRCVPPRGTPSPDAGRPRRQRAGLGGHRSRRRAHRPAGRSASRFLHGRAAAARRRRDRHGRALLRDDERGPRARLPARRHAGRCERAVVPTRRGAGRGCLRERRRSRSPRARPGRRRAFASARRNSGRSRDALVAATSGLGIERHLSLLPLPVLLENVAGVYAPMLRRRHMLRSAARRGRRARRDGVRPPTPASRRSSGGRRTA